MKENTKTTLFKIIKLLLFIVFMVFALMHLNSAAYSYWAYFGPPTEYPEAWKQRSIVHFGYAVGLVSASIICVLSARPDVKLFKSKAIIILLVIILVSGLTPHIRKFMKIDRCLDSGGRWNYRAFICEH